MSTGLTRNIHFIQHSSGDRVAVAFFLSCEDGSFASRTLKDFSRAAAFMEMSPEDMKESTEMYLRSFAEMTHEERKSHQSHYMSSITAYPECGWFGDETKNIEEFADWTHNFHLNEPGNITRKGIEFDQREAARQQAWDEWSSGNQTGPAPWTI